MNAKVEVTVTLAPSDRPRDDVVSYVTQSDSSITTHTQMGSVTFMETETDSQNKTGPSGKTNIRVPPPPQPYIFNIHFDDVPHDVMSFFRKAAYRLNISIVATLNIL